MQREPDSPAPRTTGSEGAIPARVAFWLHRGAPGGDHVDLFIAPFDSRHPPDPDARLAGSWRLPVDAFPEGARAPGDGRWPAAPTEPHRTSYLMPRGAGDADHCRDLGDGRGTARLLAWGDGWATFAEGRTEARATVARVAPSPGIALELEITVHRSANGTTSAEFRTPRGRSTRA